MTSMFSLYVNRILHGVTFCNKKKIVCFFLIHSPCESCDIKSQLRVNFLCFSLCKRFLYFRCAKETDFRLRTTNILTGVWWSQSHFYKWPMERDVLQLNEGKERHENLLLSEHFTWEFITWWKMPFVRKLTTRYNSKSNNRCGQEKLIEILINEKRSNSHLRQISAAILFNVLNYNGVKGRARWLIDWNLSTNQWHIRKCTKR